MIKLNIYRHFVIFTVCNFFTEDTQSKQKIDNTIHNIENNELYLNSVTNIH